MKKPNPLNPQFKTGEKRYADTTQIQDIFQTEKEYEITATLSGAETPLLLD